MAEPETKQLQLTCEACGAVFSCCPEPIESCWCASMRVSEESRRELQSKFSRCICPDCLQGFADSAIKD